MSRSNKKKRQRYGRRSFLKGAAGGAAGALLGLPLLESVVGEKRAWAAPGDGPRRLLIFSVGHSVDVAGSGDTVNWQCPGANGAALTTMSPMCEPLAPYASKVLQLIGIDNIMAQSCYSNGHNASSRTLLSYQPHHAAAFNGDGSLVPSEQQTDANELSWIGDNPPASYPIGPSIHRWLADQMGVVALDQRCGEPNGEHARTFYASTNGSGQQIIQYGDEEPNPQAAFDDLFAGFTGGGPSPSLTPLERLRAKRGSVLDHVIGRFDSLIGQVGAADKLRLERHADHMRAIEQKIEQVVEVVCETPTLSTAGLPSNFEDGNGRFDDLIVDAQMDLIATAFACQATPIAHLHMSNMQGNKFPFLNGGVDMFDNEGNGTWHGAVHHDDGEGAAAQNRRLVAMRWYPKLVADMVAKLEAIPDGDNGTVMDNTIIVFISSLRLSWHSTEELPCLIVGDLGGKLNSGRKLIFNGSRTLGDLWTTVANLMLMDNLNNGWGGAPVSHFGFNTGVFTGWGGNTRPWHTGNLPILAG